MEELTESERRCLDIIRDLLAAGRQPSILEVAKLMGITKGGANHHFRSLRAKGALRGPRVVGKWELTRDGSRALEKKS